MHPSDGHEPSFAPLVDSAWEWTRLRGGVSEVVGRGGSYRVSIDDVDPELYEFVRRIATRRRRVVAWLLRRSTFSIPDLRVRMLTPFAPADVVGAEPSYYTVEWYIKARP
jgi:hypothetical protein